LQCKSNHSTYNPYNMKYYFTLLTLIVACMTAKAVDVRTAVIEYYQRCPQEKIFVHTDKDQYVAGDTVWFRAHLVDAMTLQEQCPSRYVYVELYDSNMSMLERHMVKCDSLGVFANALSLSSKLPTGSYTLMAYTQWMQNFSNRQFFYKRITVAEKDAKSVASTDDATYVSNSPVVSNAANAITLSQRNEHLQIQYQPQENEDLSSLALAIYGSGNIVVVESLRDKPVTFIEKELCCGTVNIAVVNKNSGAVVAERLAFIKGAGLPEVSLALSEGSGKEKSVSIAVTNCEGMPLDGDFSVSITDADIVKKDTTQQDIAAYLLAGSELEPLSRSFLDAWGSFSTNDVAKLDNIIAQQGVKRFSCADVINGNLPQLKYYIQRDQRISGTVQGTLGKKLKTPHILLLNPVTGALDRYELPSDTHFNLTDMDFPENTTFLLEANRRNDSKSLIELKLDERVFPEAYSVKPTANKKLLSDDFLKYQHLQAASYSLHGMNYLDEVEVKGHKKTEDETQKAFASLSYVKKNDGPIVIQDMKQWLRSKGLFTGKIGSPVVYIDGFLSDKNELFLIHPEHVLSMYYYDSNSVAVTSKGKWIGANNGNGVLIVETSLSKENVMDHPLAVKEIRPLGYMPATGAAGCNAPMKEGQTDRRTTLLWQPYVKLSEAGKATLQFYPSDTSKKYRVTIQGVTSNGQVISKVVERSSVEL